MPPSPNDGPSPSSDRLRDLFDRALSLATERREAFVREQAADDPALVAQLLSMLRDGAVASTALRAAMNAQPAAHSPSGAAPPPAGERVQATATEDLLDKLAQSPRLDAKRFTVEGEVGQGGMGAVYRVHDQHLNRRLALKVLLDRGEPRDADEQRLAHQLLGRFLEEAQVTSQLDHPGVVPVHELGLDEQGKVWFTMRLVKGRTASEVFADAYARRDGWTWTRGLEVVLRVCDTMSYAHDKGVLHRDLKPSNVMVGRFGEVYVMDWGLAKVVGQADRHDVRIRPEGLPSGGASKLDTARKRDAEHDTGSSVVTMDGAKLGTPSYMSPEQARGEIAQLDTRTDVYAIGAMVYELVTGRAPYTTPGVRKPAYRILEDVVDGPPKAIEELQKGVPAELVAIVGKAMAREREQRYASTAALAADLRAFLGSQVVSAYRTGALVELRLWVRRNKPLAASLAAAVLILVMGIVGTWWLANVNAALAQQKAELAAAETKAKDEALAQKQRADEVAATNARLAKEKGALAVSEGRAKAEAQRTVRNFNQLSAVVRLKDVLAKQESLWPAWPDKVAALQEWLERDCAQLLAQRPQIEAAIAELRGKAQPLTAEQSTGDEDRRSAEFLLNALVDVLAGLNAMEGKERVEVTQRLTWARQVEDASILAHSARWAEAQRAILQADGVTASEMYRAVRIELPPQMGLVPIGMNPVTQLWEFYDLRSAWDGLQSASAIPIPTHKDDGSIDVASDTGIVFVLVPGGPSTIGCQSTDPKGTNYDPAAETEKESPPVQVTLDPFFIGRHEVTQAQWLRIVGKPQSRWTQSGPTAPAERVSVSDASTLLRALGARLPTEAQWEYACRSGTSTPWWTGSNKETLLGRANLVDQSAYEYGARWESVRALQEWPELRDGFPVTSAVGSFQFNSFGLYDCAGNVFELVADDWAVGHDNKRSAGDGLRLGGATGLGTYKGGSFRSSWTELRSAARYSLDKQSRQDIVGIRVTRPITLR